MKNILTSTALASALALGTMMTANLALAQDSGNQRCVGENCPAPDMQNQGGNKKRMKGVDQNNQNSGQSTDQTLPRKKRVQGMDQNQGENGDQTMPRKRKVGAQQNNNDTNVDVNVQVGSQQRMRHANWRFDPSQHQRRRSRSATFRFYYEGYWYPQPYWNVYSVRSARISCGEGRDIVAERFNRVRVVECNGGTYTYLGRREGETFRILLSARTGRIVGRASI